MCCSARKKLLSLADSCAVLPNTFFSHAFNMPRHRGGGGRKIHEPSQSRMPEMSRNAKCRIRERAVGNRPGELQDPAGCLWHPKQEGVLNPLT
ncbi:MAG: hypothetical protein QOD01_2479 [Actinomycetota bacterium]|nr:hypothetical protein [Actinomycetota bacterium]